MLAKSGILTRCHASVGWHPPLIVMPAKAGIQSSAEYNTEKSLDTSFRWYDRMTGPQASRVI